MEKKEKTATPITTKPGERGSGGGGVGGEEKVAERTSWAEKTQHKRKLTAPMNHMIDVASYWACACQKTAELRHLHVRRS